MNIIPASPYKTNSNAELRVFDKIKESFANDNRYLAFHSLNLTKHEKKRFGEADFVIICEFGLFVFEVKGGKIIVDNGVWSTTDRYGEAHRLKESPFRQAETAMNAIISAIEVSNLFPNLKISRGFGVIFPNNESLPPSSEWDLHTVCVNRNFKGFEIWLKNFFKYWESKHRNDDKLTSHDIASLKKYLRPNFELLESLQAKIANLESNVVKLTEEQYKYLDMVAENSQVLCRGGAGTGKTFLAAELARRLGNADKNILFLCKSNWLRRYLESKIHNENVVVSTIESVKVDQRRADIIKYDVLIVDEGQDLFNLEDVATMDDLVNGGLETGEWYIFHDINNQYGLFNESKVEVLEMLESYKPAKFSLQLNCRNSMQIVDKVQSIIHCDMGSEGTGDGPEVTEVFSKSPDDSSYLEEEINKLLKSGISPSSITILSPFSYEQSAISKLPEKMKRIITKLDDFSVRSLPVQEISFAEIKNFKGLENEVVIVIDLIHPTQLTENQDRVKHYVGMTRARAQLSLIWQNI